MKRQIASQLLEIGAVHLKPNNPFTWSSGLKSPIYCDNRLTLSYPELRQEIAKGLAELIEKEFSDCEMVAGTATAGIPHAAWVSDILNLPMCYVRSKPKGHGRGNQIEGAVKPGQKVVVVEDLISTGGSVITAVDALREAGCEVLGAVAIFTYELERGYKQLEDSNIEAFAISDYSTLIEVALEQGLVSETELEKLKEWRKNPEDESWMKL